MNSKRGAESIPGTQIYHFSFYYNHLGIRCEVKFWYGLPICLYHFCFVPGLLALLVLMVFMSLLRCVWLNSRKNLWHYTRIKRKPLSLNGTQVSPLHSYQFQTSKEAAFKIHQREETGGWGRNVRNGKEAYKKHIKRFHVNLLTAARICVNRSFLCNLAAPTDCLQLHQINVNNSDKEAGLELAPCLGCYSRGWKILMSFTSHFNFVFMIDWQASIVACYKTKMW